MSYQSEVLADSPWGFWLCNETSGTTLADSSDSADSFLGQSGPLVSQPAIAWQSATEYGSTSATLATSPATVEAWVYLTANPLNNTPIVACAASAGNGTHDKALYVDTSGKVNWYIYAGSETTLTAPSALTLNAWHHIVASVGAAGAKIRIDGTTVVSNVGATSSYTGAMKVFLHGGGVGYTSGSPVRVAAPAVWNSQLSDATTDAHYGASSASYAATVIGDAPWGYWQQTETSGTTLADSSGNSRTITLTGTGRKMTVSGSPTLNQAGPGSLRSVAWPASTDYATSQSPLLTSDVTVEAWVYLTANPLNNTPIVACAASAGNGTHDKALYVRSDGKVAWYVYPTSPQTIVSTSALSLNAWHHIVGSVGPSGQKLRIDKVTVASNVAVTTSYAASQSVFIHNGGGGYTSGNAVTIAAPALYLTQLSDVRTDAHYDATTGGTTGTLAGSLPPLTGALSGVVTNRGNIAGTLAAPTGALTASTPRTGTLSGTLPAITGQLGGSSGTTTGTLAGALPALTGDLYGVVTTTGAIAGNLPALTGSIDGEVGSSTGTTGSLGGNLPALTGELFGLGVGEDAQLALAYVDVEAFAFVELVPTADVDVAVPILSEKHPAPALSAALPATQAWVDYTPTTTVVGFAHVWVDGQDVTYFRGSPVIVRNWQKEVPFGDKAAMFEMPQLDPWDVPGEGDLSFLRPKAPVVVGIVDLDGNVHVKFSGFLHARTRGFDTGGEDYVFEAHGDMWAGLYQYAPVVPYQPPVDIGVLIPRLLNGIINRPFDPIPETVTGRTTTYRPARREYVWQSVQNILAKDGWTDDGRQWTIVRRGATSFGLALKAPMSTVHGTFAAGNPGIDLGNLGVDEDSAVDHVFCSWTTANGGGSTNTKYPGYELTNGKPYPNSSELDIIVLGTTDADTDSGSGVTDWQRKVVELGLSTLTVTGVMSSAWVAEVRRVQEQFDLLVDGEIGPQTWTAVLTRVDESLDLTPRRLPMAWKPATWPTKDSANGVILGPNPAFDEAGGAPNQIDLELGGPLTRADVLRMARTYLDVNGTAVVTGSIQYRGCLDDLARTDIDVGQNHKVLGFEGRDVVLQVGRVTVDLDVGTSETGGSYVVTVDVDERARDALTIDQILERNREALPDPARRPGNPALLSRQVKDRGFSWDADSPCGILPRTAVNGAVGLWSRAFVPFSEVGRLSGIRLNSEMPFALAITASLRLTENMMLARVGDPLAQADPWRGDTFEWLIEEHGLIGAWGSLNDPCGYGYDMKSNGGAFKGLFVDGTTLEYVTEPETSPLVAVHLFAQTSGSVWGRFYPAWDVS